jgi:hypothetical protein
MTHAERLRNAVDLTDDLLVTTLITMAHEGDPDALERLRTWRLPDRKIESFLRGRVRQKHRHPESMARRSKRFASDPNRLATALAASAKRNGRFAANRDAVAWAVAFVNRSFAKGGSSKQAHPSIVLQRLRQPWKQNRPPWELNNDDGRSGR